MNQPQPFAPGEIQILSADSVGQALELINANSGPCELQLRIQCGKVCLMLRYSNRCSAAWLLRSSGTSVSTFCGYADATSPGRTRMCIDCSEMFCGTTSR
jgi:hypothetical protein